MQLKLLIDENLSPTLVDRLAEQGVLAQHVAHLGRDGMTDPELWRYAFEHDMVVVTVNVSDFITLAAGSDLHAGGGRRLQLGYIAEKSRMWCRASPFRRMTLAMHLERDVEDGLLQLEKTPHPAFEQFANGVAARVAGTTI